MVIPRAAIVLVILGAVLCGSFVRKGPSLSTPSTPLRWSTGAIDAGSLEVQHSLGGVDFIRAGDADEPALSFAVLRRGERFIAADDFNWFHLVEKHDGRLWAIAENTTEGGGPTIELLLSEDDGHTFEHRASVPKPNYQATFERFEAHADDLMIELSIDQRTPVRDEWVWPWWRVDWPDLVGFPAVGPGPFRIRSKNGGRSWRLEP